jgi:hypothetical protein
VIDDRLTQDDARIAYIYFDYKDSKAQTVENVFRSLLKQLLWPLALIPPEVESLYDQHFRQSKVTECSVFARLLQQVASNNPSSVSLLFDALDECDVGVRDEIISLIRQLKISGARVFCTSRQHLVTLPDQLDTATVLKIRAHDEDVRNYLTCRMTEWKFAESFKERIINRIVHGVDGK